MAKNKYAPPKDGQEFVKYWNLLLPQVTARDNFKEGHLYQLKVLCDLMVEYDKLSELLEFIGYTYEVIGGRNGDQKKLNPEVTQLNRARADIKIYMAMLGIELSEDKETTVQEEIKDEWG